MEVICVNDTYPKEVLEFYAAHGVTYPKKDKIDCIREVIRHSTGETGIRLEGIRNPEVPIKHRILGISKIEPTFSVKRFRKLNGEEITKEALKIEKYENPRTN